MWYPVRMLVDPTWQLWLSHLGGARTLLPPPPPPPNVALRLAPRLDAQEVDRRAAAGAARQRGRRRRGQARGARRVQGPQCAAGHAADRQGRLQRAGGPAARGGHGAHTRRARDALQPDGRAGAQGGSRHGGRQGGAQLGHLPRERHVHRRGDGCGRGQRGHVRPLPLRAAADPAPLRRTRRDAAGGALSAVDRRPPAAAARREAR
eukprot:1251445-Prymnesium_polylepis.1